MKGWRTIHHQLMRQYKRQASIKPGILILGAGGHGKVVADILQCQKIQVMGFLDDDSTRWGTLQLDLPVLGPVESYAQYAPNGLVIGVGNLEARQDIVRRLGTQAYPLWRDAIHPRAIIAQSVQLGRGVMVAAGAVVNPDAVLGEHVIVNTGCTIDHDSVVGDFSHIAPGAHLAGGVTIGRETLIGIGATVIEGKYVGDRAVVGAGAVVIHDISDGMTAVGVPARVNALALSKVK